MLATATRMPPATQKLAETRKAIDAGIALLRADGYQASFPESLSAIVWRLLQEAADTLARLPDRERVWLLAADRVAWPEVLHTAQEQFEAETQRLTDARMSKEEPPIRRLQISNPGAVSRMLVVLDWLQHVRGRRVKRDQLIALAMAHGEMTTSAIRNKFMGSEKTDYALLAVRRKVVKQISAALLYRLSPVSA